jgi:hypothetical protein
MFFGGNEKPTPKKEAGFVFLTENLIHCRISAGISLIGLILIFLK